MLSRRRYVPPTLLAPKWRLHLQDALEYLAAVPSSVYFDLVWLDDLHDYQHVCSYGPYSYGSTICMTTSTYVVMAHIVMARRSA